METKSFTIRMPVDILDALEEQAEKGKRSELVICLLREGLGLPTEAPQDGVQHISVLQRVQDLRALNQCQHELVMERLTEVERRVDELAIHSKTESKTDQRKTESITSVLQSEDADGWITTREAYAKYAPEGVKFRKFSETKPEQMLERYGLEADTSRKIRGNNKSKWLRQRL